MQSMVVAEGRWSQIKKQNSRHNQGMAQAAGEGRTARGRTATCVGTGNQHSHQTQCHPRRPSVQGSLPPVPLATSQPWRAGPDVKAMSSNTTWRFDLHGAGIMAVSQGWISIQTVSWGGGLVLGVPSQTQTWNLQGTGVVQSIPAPSD